MLQVKTAKVYQSLSVLKQILAVGTWIVVAALLHQLVPDQEYGMILGGVTIIGAFGLALFFLRNGSKFRWNKFNCPDCKAHIEKPLQNSDAGGEPILYMCSQCNVLWYSGNTARD